MKQRGRLVSNGGAAGALVVGLILVSAALLWAGRSGGDTMALERQRDDEIFARARATGRDRLRGTSVPNQPEISAPAPPVAESPSPKADVRPRPPRDIYQTRPTAPTTFDTGLVFRDSRPPDEPAKRVVAVPTRAPSREAPLTRFMADLRPPVPSEEPDRGPRGSAPNQHMGLVFSARPPSPPEGADKYRR